MGRSALVEGHARNFAGDIFGPARGVEGAPHIFAKDAPYDGQWVSHWSVVVGWVGGMGGWVGGMGGLNK